MSISKFEGRKIDSIFLHQEIDITNGVLVPQYGGVEIVAEAATFLLLHDYGNDELPKSLEKRLFSKEPYTCAINLVTNEVYIVTFHEKGESLSLCFVGTQIKIPTKYNVLYLKRQKRPFWISFHNSDLLGFMDRELSYEDLRKNYLFAFKMQKCVLRVGKHFCEEVRSFHTVE